MRIAFSGTGLIGHLVPMFPLMRAFLAAGHEVAVITSAELESFLHSEGASDLVLLPGGPLGTDSMKSMELRLGTSPATNPIPSVIAEFFAGQQVDAGFDTALREAEAWAPDVVISETMDYVGCLIAAKLRVPFYRHTFGPTRPSELTDALLSVAAQRASAVGLTVAKTEAFIDVFPAELQDPAVPVPARRMPLRPEIHGTTKPVADLSAETEAHGAHALITFGTVFTDPGIRERVAGSLDDDLWHLVITQGAIRNESLPASTPTRRYVPFVPLSQLLPGTDVVVTAGGAGTVLSALIAGIPMVILPLGADHGINALRAERAGVAVVVREPEDVGHAADQILSTPSYRDRSTRIAALISALPSAAEVARLLEKEVLEHHEQSRN